MPRMKNPEKKVKALLDELNEYYSQLLKQEETMERDLRQKYPYEKYGIYGEIKVEEKMKKFKKHMRQVNLYITCLHNTIWTVTEEMKKYADKQ